MKNDPRPHRQDRNTLRNTIGQAIRLFCWVALYGLVAQLTEVRAAELQKVDYLLPSAVNVPAFIPLVLAKRLGYFSEAGYDVNFVTGKGGVDVAKQVGVGNADVGIAIGDTPILVRGNGVPVKVVALLGGGSLTSIVARRDHGVLKIDDLRGKKISVLSFQDTTYYALLGTLSSVGIRGQDIHIESVGPGSVTNLVLTGDVDACSCVPEREVDIKNGLSEIIVFPTKDFIPSMSQAVLASDEAIAKRPEFVRAMVRATLRALRHIIDDQHAAAAEYVEAVPAYKGREAYIEQILHSYADHVYGGQKVLGEMDPAQLDALQRVYLKENIIHGLLPVDQLYTNQFIR